jgi:hypothetical protein
VIKVKIRSDYREGLSELKLYDGNRLLAEPKPNAYNIWSVPCTLSKPGVWSFIVHAKLKTGKMVTSRPATMFVSPDRKGVGTRSPLAASRPDAGAGSPVVGWTSYPSPAVVLTVGRSGPVTVDMLDARGRVAKVLARGGHLAEGTHHLQIKGLSPGVYGVAVEGDGRGGGVHRSTIVVQ